MAGQYESTIWERRYAFWLGRLRALWHAIDRAGSEQVRVIFLTAGTQSPLEGAELASLRQILHRDEERSAVGYELDRSGVYGGFHCYMRR